MSKQCKVDKVDVSRHGGYGGVVVGCIPRRLQLLLKAAAARDRNDIRVQCGLWGSSVHYTISFGRK